MPSPVPVGSFLDLFPVSVLTTSTLHRPGELPRDTEVLRTLTRHNRLQVGGAGLFPCAGGYAVVESAGTLRRGDRASLN